MKFRTIVQRHPTEIAFVVGNGINRFGARSGNSWESLLVELWNRSAARPRQRIPKDIALTEFFDLVALDRGRRRSEKSLQKEFCGLLGGWAPGPHHRKFVAWAAAHETPVLTTNFDNNLGAAGDCELRHLGGREFTDFYPWRSCYSNREVTAPEQRFAIWHVNGMERYHRSIRLGLTHYMGSVSRARGWMHGGGSKGLFSSGNVAAWEGAASWLQVVLTRPLAIFGLGLESDEVFLRWLLIERARFFRRFPERSRRAWFVHAGGPVGPGKRLFLESLGIEPIQAESYEELYREPWE